MRKKQKYIDEVLEHADIAVADFGLAKKMKGGWHEWFGNGNPIIVDYGCGRGAWAVGMAAKHPEWNFLGLEFKRDRITQACKKVEDLTNVKFSNMVGANLSDVFAEGEVFRVVVNCPEPNERSREKKRRLFFGDNLKSVGKVLAKGGEIWLKTDSEVYFEDAKEELASGWEIVGDEFEDDVVTEYEERWLTEGRKFFILRACKI